MNPPKVSAESHPLLGQGTERNFKITAITIALTAIALLGVGLAGHFGGIHMTAKASHILMGVGGGTLIYAAVVAFVGHRQGLRESTYEPLTVNRGSVRHAPLEDSDDDD